MREKDVTQRKTIFRLGAGFAGTSTPLPVLFGCGKELFCLLLDVRFVLPDQRNILFLFFFRSHSTAVRIEWKIEKFNHVINAV